jgi:hypothetical protein
VQETLCAQSHSPYVSSGDPRRRSPQGLRVAPVHFAEQRAVLRRYGQLMRLPAVVQARWARKIPRRAVVVTFDDGYADNLYGRHLAVTGHTGSGALGGVPQGIVAISAPALVSHTSACEVSVSAPTRANKRGNSHEGLAHIAAELGVSIKAIKHESAL